MIRGGRKPQFYETGRMHPFNVSRIQYLDVEINRMKTLVFAGSTRSDSLHRKLAREIAGRVPESTLIELRDLPMPLYDGDLEAAEGVPASARTFKKLLREHETLIIASPEYNGFFPALVKNVIDWATRPEPGESHSLAFCGKRVVLVSASPGPGGGRRGLVQLREQLEAIGASVIGEVSVPKALHADFAAVAREVAQMADLQMKAA